MIRYCKCGCGKELTGRANKKFVDAKHKKYYENSLRGTPKGNKSKGSGGNFQDIKCPQGLNPVASAYWDKVAPMVIERGHLNILSEGAFAELCDLYSRLDQSDDQLKLKYSKQFLDYCKAFYLTPLSNRGNFGLPEDKPKEENKKTRFFENN